MLTSVVTRWVLKIMVLTQERHGLLKTDCRGERIPENSIVGGDNKSPQRVTSQWSAFIIEGEFYCHFVSIILNIDQVMTNQGTSISLGSVWVPVSCDNPFFFYLFTQTEWFVVYFSPWVLCCDQTNDIRMSTTLCCVWCQTME